MTKINQRALVTGGAGFIGSHLVDNLLNEGWIVSVVDNFDPFYAAEIKQRNIEGHLENPNYSLIRADIRKMNQLLDACDGCYDVIIHIAAKAGVRPSIVDPLSYQDVNVKGTQNLLELAKRWNVPRFVFASSSSVYGVNENVPWSEEDHVLLPISPYASTKVSGELLGHVYSHLFGIRFIALRFFTVYGPRQRPDLAIHKFARLMLSDEEIPVFGNGESRRDYTYIEDIILGIRGAMEYSGANYGVFNLGNNRTIGLSEMIASLEDHLNIKARITRFDDQPGDVPQTWADITRSQRHLNYEPGTSFQEGISKFVAWIREN